MMTRKSTFYAEFDASLLWMLEPFVSYARAQEETRFIKGHVFIEPADQGGAYIGAVCGHAMIIAHDRGAVCREPMTLCVPWQIFAAAAPASPVHMTYCGEDFLVPVPEWMQPGSCYAHSAGIFIHPRMRPPIWSDEDDEFWPCLAAVTASTSVHRVGIDYSVAKGVPADWRKPLKSAATTSDAVAEPYIAANPEILGLFERAYQTALDDAIVRETEPPVMQFRFTGLADAIVVSIDGRPDIIGCLMPQKSARAPITPWHFLKAPRGAATKSSGDQP